MVEFETIKKPEKRHLWKRIPTKNGIRIQRVQSTIYTNQRKIKEDDEDEDRENKNN